jgi:hypothetical protein
VDIRQLSNRQPERRPLIPNCGQSRVERDRRNRRAAKRYGLDLQFDYRVFGRDGSVQEGWGRTLNLSSGGLLVAPDQPICKGRTIEITVQLPAQFKDAPGPRLVVLGHVLRSDAAGAAIRILRHGFIHVSSQELPVPRAALAVEAAGGRS